MARIRTERISITLPSDTKKAIERLARERGTSTSRAVRSLIENGLTTQVVVELGGDVVARMPDGDEWLLASPTGGFVIAPKVAADLPSIGPGPGTRDASSKNTDVENGLPSYRRDHQRTERKTKASVWSRLFDSE